MLMRHINLIINIYIFLNELLLIKEKHTIIDKEIMEDGVSDMVSFVNK